MKEAKFKAWDKYNRKMIYLGTLEDIYMARAARRDYDFANYEILQYTGLNDKNEKNIYEGDILEVEDHINMRVIWSYEDGKWITQSGRELGKMLKEYKCKEIGNIYSNPKLLNK